ncbi:MAG: DUF6599 family protein [Terriglobales bacterium]
MKLGRLGLILVLWGGVFALAIPPHRRAPAAPTLPAAFAGWHKVARIAPVPAPSGSQAAAMAEYGLISVEHETYRHSGSQVQVTGYRFRDASGAYGAFTYFRPATFHAFSLRQKQDLAAAGGTGAWFTHGAWLVQVQMAQPDAMSLSQMRDLAAATRIPAGSRLALPQLPQYLPQKYEVAGSLHYAEGPASFAASCSWLAPTAVGFNQDAETVLATYDLPHRPAGAQLLLISYPTPQMARTHWAQLHDMAGISSRRSGPFLILVHGLSAPQAAALLHSVNYDADFLPVPPQEENLAELPGLIIGIFVLCAFVIGISLVLGVITGWVSARLDRILPGGFRLLRPETPIRLQLNVVEPPNDPRAFGHHASR